MTLRSVAGEGCQRASHALKRLDRPAPYATRGALAKYAKLVSSASEGAVAD